MNAAATAAPFSENGQAKGKSKGKGAGKSAKPDYLSARESADLVAEIELTQKLPAKDLLSQLEPVWHDGVILAHQDKSDGVEDWLNNLETRHPDLAGAVRNEVETSRKRLAETIDAKARASGDDLGLDEADYQAEAKDYFERKAEQAAKEQITATIKNYVLVPKVGPENEAQGFQASPATVRQIDTQVDKLVGDWPKKAGGRLFVEGRNHKPEYLKTPNDFFSWLDNKAKLSWEKGPDFITQERYFLHRSRMAAEFDSVESMPHTPELPECYYMYPPLPKSTGKIDQFVDSFQPATAADRSLIIAALATPAWGCEPGLRPMFLVTGPERDEQQGRGVGKSTLTSLIAWLHGKEIEVLPSDEIADVKTRALSPSGLAKRIARVDNIKTYRFSWDELEGFVTANQISGRALYLGEGERPNNLTWFITLNGASLSKDIAQRVVTIQLERPKRDANWDTKVRAFMKANRWEILSELRDLLNTEPAEVKEDKSRWPLWQKQILGRLPHVAECQRVVAERSLMADEDDSERQRLRMFFADRIGELEGGEHNPDTAHLHIETSLMVEWLNECEGKQFDTARGSSRIKTMMISEVHPPPTYIDKDGKEKRSRGTNGFSYLVWKGLDMPDGSVAANIRNTRSGGKAGRNARSPF